MTPVGVPKETLGLWPSHWEQRLLPGPPGGRPLPPLSRRHPIPSATEMPDPHLSPPCPPHLIGSGLPVLRDSVSSVCGVNLGGLQRCRCVTRCPPPHPPPPPAIPGAGTSLQTCSCSPVRPGDTVTARHSASGIHRAPVPAMAAATAVATAAARPVRAPAPLPRPRQRPGLRAPAATCPRPLERE